jgi:hypothetical protein
LKEQNQSVEIAKPVTQKSKTGHSKAQNRSLERAKSLSQNSKTSHSKEQNQSLKRANAEEAEKSSIAVELENKQWPAKSIHLSKALSTFKDIQTDL